MKHDFFVTGIGASAGGIPALKDFFTAIPLATGIAYIIITHLRREHESQLDQVIRRYTDLPVCRLTENTAIKPDHIYVLIENTMVTVKEGILSVRERRKQEIINNAVDIFFESLAADFGEKAAGIVLSGCGSDGFKGSTAIKSNGGIVMVQDPESAQFSGMPETIVNFDHPAVKATPAQLATQLLKRVELLSPVKD